MKKISIVLALLLAANVSLAGDTFQSRRAHALRLESTEVGAAYWDKLQEALDAQELNKVQGRCFMGVAQREGYLLVADVTSVGKFERVEVQPKNDQSTCVAEEFQRLQAPPLPKEFHENGFPISINVSWTDGDAP